MKTWLCLVLASLTFTTGCARGYYESPPANEASAYEAPAPGWYRNPETEAEYQQRLWWENYESEREMLPRPFRRFP